MQLSALGGGSAYLAKAPRTMFTDRLVTQLGKALPMHHPRLSTWPRSGLSDCPEGLILSLCG